jgi:hypothetical protein
MRQHPSYFPGSDWGKQVNHYIIRVISKMWNVVLCFHDGMGKFRILDDEEN